nr:hypothetical protein [uncultured Chryseobacterium sp.]
MKNLFYNALIMIFTLSCGREIIEYRMIDKYSYTNNTDSDMDIYTYRQGKKTKYQLTKENTFSQALETNSGSTEDIIFYADSIKIVYGQSKFKIWKSADINSRNILMKKENYTKTVEKNRYAEYQFIFNQQDANQTLPCNGNCD